MGQSTNEWMDLGTHNWHPPQILLGWMTSSPTWQRRKSLGSRSLDALPNLWLLVVRYVVYGERQISVWWCNTCTHCWTMCLKERCPFSQTIRLEVSKYLGAERKQHSQVLSFRLEPPAMFSFSPYLPWKALWSPKAQFRYIKIQSETKNITERLWGINPYRLWTTWLDPCRTYVAHEAESTFWLTDPLPVFECLLELLLSIRLFSVDKLIKKEFNSPFLFRLVCTEQFQHVSCFVLLCQLTYWILNVARTR